MVVCVGKSLYISSIKPENNSMDCVLLYDSYFTDKAAEI